MEKPVLAIILPCFNEEEILPDSSKALQGYLVSLVRSNTVSQESFICFVDDGSYDGTWQLIAAMDKGACRGVKLSHNFGHQNALMAGLFTYLEAYDIAITLDVDLQDDFTVIDKMIHEYTANNCEVVYGVRNKRKTDTLFKRSTAQGFYKLMRFLGVEIIYNHSDFRLASQRVVKELARHGEVNLFLRAIFPAMGFKSNSVYYERTERKAGRTKFSLLKMMNFAVDGITSFSVRPLRMISIIGMLVFMGTICLTIYASVSFLLYKTAKGWMSTVLPIYFLGGIQILCIGVIGEYLGKIYKEVKQRPRYIVESVKE